MLFNPDHNKQAVEILFWKKREKDNSLLILNGDSIQTAISQKHQDLVLDSNLDFSEHINSKINKCNEIIGIMKKLSLYLSWKTLVINNKKNLKVLVNELSSVKNNLLRIFNFLDFDHVCNIIISNNEKSVLKCKYTNKKEVRDLIPGYEVNPTRFSHDCYKVIFNFLRMS